MSDPASFHGPALENDRRGRRALTLAALLIIAFIAIAIAKPWGNPAAPVVPAPLLSSGVAGASASDTAGPSESPPLSPAPSEAVPAPVALAGASFQTPIPPPPTATWTGLTWHQLEPSDPLALVRSVLHWRGGFVAVGADPSGGITTPVWTSTDGARWEPLPFDTSTTFWPGLRIIGLAELSTGLVAVTELGAPSFCVGGPGCLPITSWSSRDGRSWEPRGFFNLEQTRGTSVAPLLAVGPAGLVAVSSGASPHAAVSSNGAHWTALPEGTIPSGFLINDLRGTPTGYVAGGLRVTSATRWDAVTLWSADGRTWTPTDPLPSAASAGVILASSRLPSTVVLSLVVGRGGLIAVGRDVAAPGLDLWWHSRDGRAWEPLPAYPPLGPTVCTGEGCGSQANGVLVGDGQRMVALRAGPDARAWASSDGLTWRPLTVTGEVPTDQAVQAVILPGGVLLSDGTTTWFGEASAK